MRYTGADNVTGDSREA